MSGLCRGTAAVSRFDRRIGSIEQLADAQATAGRVDPRLRIREVDNTTQLRVGETLILNTKAFEETIIRLPEFSASGLGLPAKVVVNGLGYARLSPPPGVTINERTDAWYVNQHAPAVLTMIGRDRILLEQSMYCLESSTSDSAGVSLTTSYQNITNSITFYRYPSEKVLATGSTSVIGSSADRLLSFRFENITESTANTAWSGTVLGSSTYRSHVSVQQTLNESFCPVGSNEIALRAKEAGADIATDDTAFIIVKIGGSNARELTDVTIP